ncbi:oligosaccharide flippase family protein [Vibrio amylolyticus]|uniref:oligosaccharide flippase family protein n=1 Tax=Vibrio amylolyticus TaxID=2847292 RepID=UPI00354E48DA
MSLNKKTVTINALWHSAASLFSTGIRFLTIPILVRILSPEDFGNVALAMAVLMFISTVLGNGGAIDTMVYFSKKRQHIFSTLFWFNLLLGCSLGGLVYFLSPSLTIWLNAPGALPYIEVLCLLFPIIMVQSVYQGHLIADMKFGYIAKVSAFASTTSTAIAVVLAFSGFGAWSLVVQHLLMHLALTVSFIYASDKQPQKLFDMPTLKAFLPFYYKTSAFNTVMWAGDQAPLLMTSKVAGTASTGIYNMMSRTSSLPREVFGQGFMMSFFAGLSDSNAEASGKASQQHNLFWAVKVNLIVLGSIYALAAILSQPAVELLLGDKFSPHWEMFRWLCLGMLFISSTGGFIGFLKGTGKIGLMTLLSVLRTTLIIGFTAAMWFHYHTLEAICIGFAIANILLTGFYFLIMILVLKFDFNDLVRCIAPTSLTLTFTSILTYVSYTYLAYQLPSNNFIYLLYGGTLFAAFYSLFSLIFAKEETLILTKNIHRQLTEKLGR